MSIIATLKVMNNKTKKLNKKLTTLIIDRKRWLRGGDFSDASYLYRSEDRKMCCLGFFCRQSGLLIDNIRNVPEPYDILDFTSSLSLEKKVRQKLKSLFEDAHETNYSDMKQNNTCDSLIYANDNIKISEPEREKRISKLFSKIGVKVKFIN